MPGLSYPFVFECSNCEEKTAATRADVGEVTYDPDSVLSVVVALKRSGWARGQQGRKMFCSGCARTDEVAYPDSLTKPHPTARRSRCSFAPARPAVGLPSIRRA